jgi:hypothetical protein
MYCCLACTGTDNLQVRGWNVLSNRTEDAIATIKAAREYDINQIQLSHQIVMDLMEVRNPDKQKQVNELTTLAHQEGIKEVLLWDHSFYGLDYYPDQYKTGPEGTIDLDNSDFWNWFKQDYRDMLQLVPEIDGLVLTFIETGARAEKQYSVALETNEKKLAAVIDAVADVVINEKGLKLYVRTFAYTEAEYANTIGAIQHVKNKDIIVMMKEAPHDFFLTHPNNRFVGLIPRPTVVEFDLGNEYNGQGLIANTWPEHVMKRWNHYVKQPHVIGYAARTDRFGDTRIVGTPNEILLYALKTYTTYTTTTAESIYDHFITQKYGADAVKYVKPAFKQAFDIVTSSLYTLGTSTANHSRLNYDTYHSSYARHVSGKWISPPIVYVGHDVNREFHYWKDVVEHLAPAALKQADGPIRTEAPWALDSAWVSGQESMNEAYLHYVITEKHFGVKQAEKALDWIRQAEGVLTVADYNTLYDLFERTWLTARLHEATAASYWGFRIYCRGHEFQTPWLNEVIGNGLDSMAMLVDELRAYDKKYPIGQWDWKSDTLMVNQYRKQITISATEKPWAYWWWMGSSVTKDGITANLKKMADAGFGGVHIIPIYGVIGDEDNYIPFLSPEWMAMLVHTTKETKRLGMGTDMTMGTGWPFGGQGVDSLHAAKQMILHKYALNGKQTDIKKYISADTKGFALYNEAGKPVFSSRPDVFPENKVRKNAKTLIVLEEKMTNQQVKRAAPGGEGLVADFFSKEAMQHYASPFINRFEETQFTDGRLRSVYNDSYEVYGANFTDDFLEAFETKRGYDLLPYLNFLEDSTPCDTRERVVTDYCETISDLLAEFTEEWVKISHEMDWMTRNQAHGSPGNLLDLYGYADTPETESFGSSKFNIPGLQHDADYSEARFGRPSPLTMKFASSAAHTHGKRLVSSESTTWLADHFKVTLAQVKPQIDELFISGINHVFYHGVTYSPPESEFPGRLFYASTNFGPHAHFWKTLPLLNRYVTDCQHIFQNTSPDNDLLLYFAPHDIWSRRNEKNIICQFDVHYPEAWLQSKATGNLAQQLWNKGFAFDYVSDKNLIEDFSFDGAITGSSGVQYKTIVIPSLKIIPVATLRKILDLARRGAPVCFENDIPEDVPGLFALEERRAELKEIKTELKKLPNVKLFTDIDQIGIARETMTDQGLSYIRKRIGEKTIYFVTNLSDRFTEGWLALSASGKFAEIYDPLNQVRGEAETKDGKIFLQLMPGTSCFITLSEKSGTQKKFAYHKEGASEVDISQSWDLSTVEGAPTHPSGIHADTLQSWTRLGEDFRYFSGTICYTKEFDLPDEFLKSDAVLLTFESLKETAEIVINGHTAGTIWSVPYRMYIPADLFQRHNKLELKVTNTSFNRVIDLDRRKVTWKNFHEINFVNILYKPYDASDKAPMESGVIGKVSLRACNKKD